MLTKDDLKAIGNVVDNKLTSIKEKQDEHTGRLLEIEQDIKSALELREDVGQVRNQVKDHEERISHVETL